LRKPYPKNRHNRGTFNTNCAHCDKYITLPNSRERKSTTKEWFCSHECHSAFQVGKRDKRCSHPKEKNPNYRGGFLKECETCKTLFWVVPCRKNIARFCSQKCQGVTKRGALNWNWVDGKTLEIYPTEFSKELRIKIRHRDGRKCQVCGVSQKECIKRLAVHHIDYNKMNNKTTNLISLCNECHNKTNHNRKYWTKHFLEHMEVYFGDEFSHLIR